MGFSRPGGWRGRMAACELSPPLLDFCTFPVVIQKSPTTTGAGRLLTRRACVVGPSDDTRAGRQRHKRALCYDCAPGADWCFTSSQSWSSSANASFSKTMPRAAASCSTARKRVANFLVPRWSAVSASRSSLRASLTTVKRRSPSSALISDPGATGAERAAHLRQPRPRHAAHLYRPRK